MLHDPNSADRINSFALVSYIPEPLSGFLNRLRDELVPNFCLRAHITILPPRPNTEPRELAWKRLCEAASVFTPFDIELNRVECWSNGVIYVSVGTGENRLKDMHAALNIGGLTYEERYTYHPHVTLAQELKPDELDELVRVAKRRWAEFKFGHVFHVDTITFVQSTGRKNWIDLGECKLGYQGRLHHRLCQPDGDLAHP